MAKAKADIRSLARAHTEGAIKTLAGIMYQKDANTAARVAAANALLDRGWGKAIQPVAELGDNHDELLAALGIFDPATKGDDEIGRPAGNA